MPISNEQTGDGRMLCHLHRPHLASLQENDDYHRKALDERDTNHATEVKRLQQELFFFVVEQWLKEGSEVALKLFVSWKQCVVE